MHTHEIYTVHSTYREDMKIVGYTFGQGERSACIGETRYSRCMSAPNSYRR